MGIKDWKKFRWQEDLPPVCSPLVWQQQQQMNPVIAALTLAIGGSKGASGSSSETLPEPSDGETMSIRSVHALKLPGKDEYVLRLEGRGVQCGQGIAGVSIHPLSGDDLRIIADEIIAQLDRIEGCRKT